MKIQWLGHSAFRLEESTGTAIVTDPYHPYVGFEMPVVTAAAVTISHNHRDHNYVQAVEGSPDIIQGLGAFEIKGVHIQSAKAYHDNVGGTERGEVIVYKFRMDGVEVCHLGDIGEDCNIRIVETIMPVNVLLIPVGGIYTLNAEQAKVYVDKIMPDVVIPMHFHTKDSNLELDKLNEFLELFEDEDIIYVEGDTVEFDRADFDGERTKVIVLEKFN
ncbi:MAG TPA: MBL fold metallo-hydrolase [Clostridia bacterium]|nr:MBL fold metallo-hydrolase [Clostridia bacterium]